MPAGGYYESMEYKERLTLLESMEHGEEGTEFFLNALKKTKIMGIERDGNIMYYYLPSFEDTKQSAYGAAGIIMAIIASCYSHSRLLSVSMIAVAALLAVLTYRTIKESAVWQKRAIPDAYADLAMGCVDGFCPRKKTKVKRMVVHAPIDGHLEESITVYTDKQLKELKDTVLVKEALRVRTPQAVEPVPKAPKSAVL